MNRYSYVESEEITMGNTEQDNDELIDNCDFIHVHDDVVKKVNDIMPDDEDLYNLADFYKVFADSTRIKILYALLESEMCVCDIAQIIGASQSAISHQLRLLKQMKLVKFRRDGKVVFYSLSDDHIQNI